MTVARSRAVGLGLAALLTLSPALVSAEEAAASAAPSPRDLLAAQLDELLGGEDPVAEMLTPLSERLKLSPDQVGKVKPVLAEGVTQMKALRDQFKRGELTGMTLMMQMTAAGNQIADRIDPYLDEEQSAEYTLMRQEQRQKMMQAMLERATSQQGASAQ